MFQKISLTGQKIKADIAIVMDHKNRSAGTVAITRD